MVYIVCCVLQATATATATFHAKINKKIKQGKSQQTCDKSILFGSGARGLFPLVDGHLKGSLSVLGAPCSVIRAPCIFSP